MFLKSNQGFAETIMKWEREQLGSERPKLKLVSGELFLYLLHWNCIMHTKILNKKDLNKKMINSEWIFNHKKDQNGLLINHKHIPSDVHFKDRA